MHSSHTFLLTFLSALGSCAPASLEPRASLPPTYSIKLIGNATSTIPNIYRDGGGGGKINGLNFIWFADGITTTGGEPKSDTSNWLNFSSNSIAYSEFNGGQPRNLQDFGTTSPKQQIPYFYNNGESDSKTAIWPNQNFATLCSGICGVGYPPVVSRATSGGVLLYNTGVSISLTGYGPVASRPTQALFYATEPQFGSFSSLVETDGYLYTFASISNTTSSNGLKLARVPVGTPFTRSTFEYWNGNAYTTTIPKLDDGGVANALNFSTDFFGLQFGPGSGDVFYNNYYGIYMMIFSQADGAIDSSVYLSYSTRKAYGWTTPVVIYTMPTLKGGYDYNLHTYPQYDTTQKVIPITFTQYNGAGYYNAFANITFS